MQKIKQQEDTTIPYKNEHSCRLQDPKKYDEFRRVKEDIEVKPGKKADAIYGIILKPKRKSELQAVRFPIKKFTETEARTWCKEHNGSFEPAKK